MIQLQFKTTPQSSALLLVEFLAGDNDRLTTTVAVVRHTVIERDQHDVRL